MRDLIVAEREKVLSQLMAGYKRDESPNLDRLAQLEEQLSPDEAKTSADSLAILRMRALFGAGKVVQAYHVMIDGLRRVPHSISLQAERPTLISAAQESLSDQLYQDPMNPLVELLYEILRKENALAIWHQVEYLKFLVGHQRYAEAARLAVPLVVLSPYMLNLRDQVEQIAIRSPHPTLLSYLRSKSISLGRKFECPEMPVCEAFVLAEKLSRLRQAVGEQAPVHVLDKQLREIIGDLNSDKPLNANLKEFYYLQAIVEERKENYFESLMIFRSLVELDPCNLGYRRSLETEMNHVSRSFTEMAEKGTLKVDLAEAYPVLREIGHVPYGLLTQVCIAEVKKGLIPQAKEKMMLQLALNPLDSDYVGAAQRVAEASQDVAWTAELRRLMVRISEERPWDLELRMSGH